MHYWDPPEDCGCISTKADGIISLFATRYEYRYNIKPSIGVYTSGSLFDGFSFLDFVNKIHCTYILNLNLGGTLTVLRKNNFSWRMYLGIGIMWGANFFYDWNAYSVSLNENVTGKNGLGRNIQILRKKYRKSGSFYELFTLYFKKGQWKNNLKYFDIIIDVSAFDFIIKDHWRIALAWKAGIYAFYISYKEWKGTNKKKDAYKKMDTKANKKKDSEENIVGKVFLFPLVLSIGYQF